MPATRRVEKTKRAVGATVDEASRRLLGRDAWTDAALHGLASGGLAAISVEHLAKALGVTKGSFYWHFEDRDALVRAVLERWERLGTDDIVASLDALTDPRERLVRLFDLSLDDLDHLRAEAALHAAASAGHPLVAPVVARVVRRRLSYTESVYRSLGLSRAEASTRATIVLGVYLGTMLLVAQGVFEGGDRSLAAQRRVLAEVLVPPPPSRTAPRPRTRRTAR